MAIINDPARRTIVPASFKSLTNDGKRKINKHLETLVNVRLRANEKEPFSAFDLLGRSNFDWVNSPCEEIYKNNINAKRGAVEQAGVDMGHILKNFLKQYKYNNRDFKIDYKFNRNKKVRSYQLV